MESFSAAISPAGNSMGLGGGFSGFVSVLQVFESSCRVGSCRLASLP